MSLVVDPVQVLEDHDQRLVEALAHQDPLDGFQGAAPSELEIELHQRVVAFDSAELSTPEQKYINRPE